jgi:hypothetical protein
MSISLEQILIFGPGIKSENPISCGLASGTKICDYCLTAGKIKGRKMLDFVSKAAMKLL